VRKARWVRAVVEGPGGCAAGRKEDEVLLETEDALALAGISGPTVIIVVGPWRLYLEGRETLDLLVDAVLAAIDDHARSGAE
jgi:hypothetical protein